MAPKNAQLSNGGVGVHTDPDWLTEACRAGVDFVNISPMRNDAAQSIEAEWLPICPNTDTALMLALAHTLMDEHLHDADFLQRYCVGGRDVSGLYHRQNRWTAQRRGLGGADDGHWGGIHPPISPPHGGQPHVNFGELVHSARRSRRTALLGIDCLGRDAGPDWLARRRFRLRLRRYERFGAAAQQPPRRVPRYGRQWGEDRDSGGPLYGYDAQSRHVLRF